MLFLGYDIVRAQGPRAVRAEADRCQTTITAAKLDTSASASASGGATVASAEIRRNSSVRVTHAPLRHAPAAVGQGTGGAI